MARKRTPAASLPPAAPTIHEATRATDLTGAVFKGAEIDQPRAVARRRAELDIVVCGHDVKANRNLAKVIERTVGPYQRQKPHTRLAGPNALPHFQQQASSPGGHSFYETAHLKARKKS